MSRVGRLAVVGLVACGRLGFDPIPAEDGATVSADARDPGDGPAGPGGDGAPAGDAPADPDGSPSTDAAPPADAPSGPPLNDDCDMATVVVAGGIYPGTTCEGDDTVDTGCAPAGTSEVFYEYTSTAGDSVQFRVTSGFEIAVRPCTDPTPICGNQNVSVMFGGAGNTIHFSVESTDGTCGSFEFSVN